MNNVNIQQELL